MTFEDVANKLRGVNDPALLRLGIAVLTFVIEESEKYEHDPAPIVALLQPLFGRLPLLSVFKASVTKLVASICEGVATGAAQALRDELKAKLPAVAPQEQIIPAPAPVAAPEKKPDAPAK